MRQYAPDREVDILHLSLDVTPDYKMRTVSGKTEIRFAPIAKPLRELKLDARDLTVFSVEASVKIAGHNTTRENIIITFEDPIPPGKMASVTITHKAEPKQGLYFRTPEMGYKPEDTHVWTQGETSEARHWFPCYDYPNEKFTSEVTCRVPEGMTVLSNGKWTSELRDAATGLKAVKWAQEKPHANYLIALAAGYLDKIEDKHGEIPLAFYTPKSQIANATNSFKDTADMMVYFEKEIGVPYPWAKYFQVVVDDFNHGGMENTSLTILTDRTLYTNATENIRSSQNLIAHELAHQWFGDYVTCKDWSNIWLNEGFATYYAHLFGGHKNGRDSMHYGLWKDANRLIADDAQAPIVYRDYKEEIQQFDARAYEKGGWVLHMLRTNLGPDLYRKCITTYLERHAFDTVVTEDLSSVIEEFSGRSFDPFFDQWVYHGGIPKLEVRYEWREKDKLARISVKQTHAVSDKVLLFQIPTKVRFITKSGIEDREIVIKEREQEFYFPFASAPDRVRFDPEYGLLAKVDFDLPNAMLHGQLEDKSDGIGRILAVTALKTRDDKETVSRLRKALGDDPFWGVRVEASKALRAIHTRESYEALSASLNQSDARARKQVALDLAGFYEVTSLEFAKKSLAGEKNPDVIAPVIEGMGKYRDAISKEMILGYLKSSSYRNSLADAAVRAIRSSDDPSYIEPLMAALGERENEFTSWGFGQGLGALGYIARNETDRANVREFLVARVNHPKRGVKVAAIAALGALKDPAALSVVETFTGEDETDSIKRAANAAAKELREAKKVPVELGDLREEVVRLKKEQEKTSKELEDIKKRLESGSGSSAGKRKKVLGIF